MAESRPIIVTGAAVTEVPAGFRLAAPGKPDAPGRGKVDRENLRERIPPELREKLRNMSPEERREAVRKWMEENGGPGAPKNPK